MFISPSTTLQIVCSYLKQSSLASANLAQLILDLCIDVVLVQEPYVISSATNFLFFLEIVEEQIDTLTGAIMTCVTDTRDLKIGHPAARNMPWWSRKLLTYKGEILYTGIFTNTNQHGRIC